MAMSQSIILNNLKHGELLADIPSAMLSSVENNNKMQDDLFKIANQATNLGYGSGVALRSAIERIKILCKNLDETYRGHSPFFNSFFYEHSIWGLLIETKRSDRNKRSMEQCHESVSELERIENEITASVKHFA